MIFDHLNDDAIFAYVLAEDGAAEHAKAERHFSTCSVCSQVRAEFEQIIQVGTDPETWVVIDDSVGAEVDPDLARDFSERARRHDAEHAASQVAIRELESVPVRSWAAWIRLRPQFHIAGMVYTLLATAKSSVEEDPKSSLSIIDVADGVARELTDRFDGPATRGSVQHERATALRFLGRYKEALAACVEAEAILNELDSNGDEKARAAWNRGTILFLMERYAEARAALDVPKDWYRTVADDLSLARIGILEGSILHDEGNIPAALDVFHTVAAVLDREGAQFELARVYVNVSNCHVALGTLDVARAFGERAMAIFASADMVSEKIRTRWMFAHLLIEHGELETGVQELSAAAAEYEKIGMIADAAQVDLERVEALLLLDEWRQAALIARRLVLIYEQSGQPVSYVKALAYLREAVDATAATPSLTRYIRTYLAQPVGQPFAPPITPLPS